MTLQATQLNHQDGRTIGDGDRFCFHNGGWGWLDYQGIEQVSQFAVFAAFWHVRKILLQSMKGQFGVGINKDFNGLRNERIENINVAYVLHEPLCGFPHVFGHGRGIHHHLLGRMLSVEK